MELTKDQIRIMREIFDKSYSKKEIDLWGYSDSGMFVPIEETKKFHEAMKEEARKFLNGE